MIDPEIEWSFDLRARHPEHAEYKSLWCELSDVTRARNECSIDVTCGSHTDMTFDIFPGGGLQSPCFIFLHGGFWRSSDKSESSFVANAFVEFGITTVVMNYRLAPAVGVDEIVVELQNSVVSLFERSSQFGINEDRIFIGGFSAGGLLAAHVLGTDWNKLGVSRPVIRGGMALSGIFDPGPLISTSHNRLLRLSIEQARNLSVLNTNQIMPRLDLVACGSNETPGFKDQTSNYLKMANQFKQDTRELWIDGKNHYDVVLEFANSKSQLAQASRRMVNHNI